MNMLRSGDSFIWVNTLSSGKRRCENVPQYGKGSGMRKDLKYSTGTPFSHCETKDQLKSVLMGECPEINF